MDTEETANIMVPMFGTICADGAAALGAIDLRADPEILDIGTGLGNFAIFLAM